MFVEMCYMCSSLGMLWNLVKWVCIWNCELFGVNSRLVVILLKVVVYVSKSVSLVLWRRLGCR